MKTKFYLLLTAFLTANLAAAQVLYSEDFDSLAIGNVGTDITGQTPGQGGWYTYSSHNSGIIPGIDDASNFQIVPEPGRGNVLLIQGTTSLTSNSGKNVTQKGLDVVWRQRSPGSNILKFSFDIYTGDDDFFEINRFFISSKVRGLGGFRFYEDYRLNGMMANSGFIQKVPGAEPPVGHTNRRDDFKIPAGIWITLEFYVDYNTSKVYYGIPSLGLVREYDLTFTLSLTDPSHPEEPPNDEPFDILLGGGRFGRNSRGEHIIDKIKIDNISISAVSTAPAVNVEEFISEKFNIYPNPAEDMVTISNSENFGIEELTVYNSSGKTVKSQNCSNAKEVTLDIESFAPGIYLLHIKTKEGTAVKKLIKK